jgi:hypothetical protein
MSFLIVFLIWKPLHDIAVMEVVSTWKRYRASLSAD